MPSHVYFRKNSPRIATARTTGTILTGDLGVVVAGGIAVVTGGVVSREVTVCVAIVVGSVVNSGCVTIGASVTTRSPINENP